MEPILSGPSMLADLSTIGAIVFGVLIGVLVGALPGLRSPMAIAILIPCTAGYFSLRLGFASAPLIMGLILASVIEENFSKAMIVNDNSILSMLERPVVFCSLSLPRFRGLVRSIRP
ncbi:MAG: hypothetical protein AAGA73_13095 [Pseudomonadota bacterium]